jgi:hypothetical protein
MLRDARRILPYLDAEGFALLRHRSAVGDFWDDAEAESVGRAEAAELVAQATGAKRVHVFDHTQRRRRSFRKTIRCAGSIRTPRAS